MKSRSLLFVVAATVACLTIGVVCLLDAEPVGASDDKADICRDALQKLYTDCYLHLGMGDEVLNYVEALQFCEAQTDTTLKTCWTNCARNAANDCGEVTECINECFQGVTACNFAIEFLYDRCSNTLYNPANDQPIDRAAALADCQSTGGQLWDCYKGCTYTEWSDCLELSKCTLECAYGPQDDDNDTDDDDNDDNDDENPNSESLKKSDGEDLEDVHGSACGF